MHSAIDSLTQTRDARAAHLATLRTRLAAAKTAIASLKAAQRQHAAALASQGAQNGAELEFWEEALGLRIEGAGREDRVRFVFAGCDGRKREREAWCELDLARGYEVVECRPRLDGERVRKVCERMGEGEDLRGFLVGMRGLFCEEFSR